MIRLVGILIGLGFTFVVLLAFVTGAYTAATEDVAETAEHAFHLEENSPEGGFAFDGPLGTWDVAQLQRVHGAVQQGPQVRCRGLAGEEERRRLEERDGVQHAAAAGSRHPPSARDLGRPSWGSVARASGAPLWAFVD